MGQLKDILPTEFEVVRRIYAYHKSKGDAEPNRPYLGASILGHFCDRFLWYNFRWCVARTFEGRLYRLFETGNLAELRFVAELRAIGCTVHETNENGEQFAVHALGGHVSGHMDGCALGIPEAPKTWHVCEFKTHNDRSFKALVKDGVEASKPQHFVQMHVYMGLSGMTRALYLAVNKDTDELYAERVRYDAKIVAAVLARAERIIRANQAPERAAGRADDYRCKFCDAYELCWGTSAVAVPIPKRTCRTCCHSTPEIDDGQSARWTCARTHCNLSFDEQEAACGSHLLLPSLVSFAEPADAGDDWIEFANASDGARWRHGAGEGQWSTEELMRTPGPIVGNKTVNTIKATFDGVCVEIEAPLIDQYSPGDNEVLWSGVAADLAGDLEALGLGDLRETVPTRKETAGDVTYTEFAGKGTNGRDILIVVNDITGDAGIMEGKR